MGILTLIFRDKDFTTKAGKVYRVGVPLPFCFVLCAVIIVHGCDSFQDADFVVQFVYDSESCQQEGVGISG